MPSNQEPAAHRESDRKPQNGEDVEQSRDAPAPDDPNRGGDGEPTAGTRLSAGEIYENVWVAAQED